MSNANNQDHNASHAGIPGTGDGKPGPGPGPFGFPPVVGGVGGNNGPIGGIGKRGVHGVPGVPGFWGVVGIQGIEGVAGPLGVYETGVGVQVLIIGCQFIFLYVGWTFSCDWVMICSRMRIDSALFGKYVTFHPHDLAIRTTSQFLVTIAFTTSSCAAISVEILIPPLIQSGLFHEPKTL